MISPEEAAPMKTEKQLDAEPATAPGSLLMLAVVSLIVGAASGLVGAVFRLSLEQADQWRDMLIAWAQGESIAGFLLVPATCAAATGVAAWLVRRYCVHASGSGIPHVEAVLRQELPPAPVVLLPVKFSGGVLAIGSGLALGREGPSVQMGASVGHLLGNVFRRNLPDCRVLLAAGAGAGLATAFNAPIAGAVFVLEELVRRFDTRTTIATFGASAGAIAVARLLVGETPDFEVAPLPYPGFGTVAIYLAMGMLAGLLGVAYNRTLLGTLGATERLRRWPVELRAAVIGAVVGLIGWFTPGLVGGGDAITQRTLAGKETLGVISLVFLLRFGLGAVSYAARTPGGLFAPMLVLGAQGGVVFGTLCRAWFPTVAPNPAAFAVVGMAAFFTAVVRAPLTGIILVIEMTGTFTLLLPMLGACFAAMLVPTLLGDPPIYDSLRERTLESQRREKESLRSAGCLESGHSQR
jgi:CIC family chloride channel protein